jgi:hypothetical protein
MDTRPSAILGVESSSAHSWVVASGDRRRSISGFANVFNCARSAREVILFAKVNPATEPAEPDPHGSINDFSPAVQSLFMKPGEYQQ